MAIRFRNDETYDIPVEGKGMVCPVLNDSGCVSSSSGDRHLTPSGGELGEVCLHTDRLWSVRAPPEEMMVSSATGVWEWCA